MREQRFRFHPVTLDGALRYSQHLRCFRCRQPTEEAAFHEACEPRVDAGESRERVIDDDQRSSAEAANASSSFTFDSPPPRDSNSYRQTTIPPPPLTFP
ncbi:MAG: hypothetical protein ABJE10_10735 [bacterium]